MHDSAPTDTNEVNRLDAFAVGQRVRLRRIGGDRHLQRRLLGLGLRSGVELDIVQFRGNGVVVARGETRIALGSGVADKLLVEPLEPEAR